MADEIVEYKEDFEFPLKSSGNGGRVFFGLGRGKEPVPVWALTSLCYGFCCERNFARFGVAWILRA
jgi:hypothetical protein